MEHFLKVIDRDGLVVIKLGRNAVVENKKRKQPPPPPKKNKLENTAAKGQ